MNRDALYRNVLRGLQESPQFPGCERSPMTSLAYTLNEASLATTPCKRLSLSSTLTDTPISIKDGSFLSDTKKDLRNLSTSSSSGKKLSPSPRLKNSPDKENLAVYYSPTPGQISRHHPSPLREVQNTVTRTLNFSPLKKLVSPARREHLSPLKNPTPPPDDCDSSSRDSGYSESGQKRDGFNVPRACAPTRKLNLDMSPKYALFKSPPEGRKARSFASLKKKSEEEDEFLTEFICGDISMLEDDDEEPSSSFSSLLSAPIQSQPTAVSVTAPTPSSGFGGPRLPIRRCLSMIDTSTPLSSRTKSDVQRPLCDSIEELNSTVIPPSFKRPQSSLECSFILESKRRKDDDSPTAVQVAPSSSKSEESDSEFVQSLRVKSDIAEKSEDVSKTVLPQRQQHSNPEKSEDVSKTVLSQRQLSNPEKREDVSKIGLPQRQQHSNPEKREDVSKTVLSQRQLSNPESSSKDLQRPKFLRCHSESHVSIMKALNVSSSRYGELTGDFSQSLSLPTVQGGKHPDLKSITIHTMAALIYGKFSDKIASFKVLDCRYPYEYEGGHIVNAMNWHNLKMVQDYMSAQSSPPKISDENTPRHVHIFHCEFSMERGPKAQRLLREIDRSANEEHYPALHFPEIYLLEGGYKAFYEAYPKLCTPNDYVKMLDENHAEDLKMFRSKSRSWAAENKQSRCPVSRAGPKRLGL